jgi:hypothetical protein
MRMSAFHELFYRYVPDVFIYLHLREAVVSDHF